MSGQKPPKGHERFWAERGSGDGGGGLNVMPNFRCLGVYVCVCACGQEAQKPDPVSVIRAYTHTT